jgi:hypothetical protein
LAAEIRGSRVKVKKKRSAWKLRLGEGFDGLAWTLMDVDGHKIRP